jgi:hypothetical protein
MSRPIFIFLDFKPKQSFGAFARVIFLSLFEGFPSVPLLTKRFIEMSPSKKGIWAAEND